jgi:hypothetical protein
MMAEFFTKYYDFLIKFLRNLTKPIDDEAQKGFYEEIKTMGNLSMPSNNEKGTINKLLESKHTFSTLSHSGSY